MDLFDILNLLLILAFGLGLMVLLVIAQKLAKKHFSWFQKLVFNLIGSILLAVPILYLGFPLRIVSIEKLGLDRFLWWWIPASLGLAFFLILLNAGIALLYQWIFKIDERKLVSFERSDFFEKMSKTPRNFTITVILGGVIAPLCEELYFRGLLLSWFLAFFDPWVGIIATSIIFGLAHFDSAGVVITGLIDGVALSLLFVVTGSIWFPIMVHIFNNSIGFALLAIESRHVKGGLEARQNEPAPTVSNDTDLIIMVDDERQECDEEKVQVRPEQDAAC